MKIAMPLASEAIALDATQSKSKFRTSFIVRCTQLQLAKASKPNF
ncbi:hypothetical protein [Nostoc favosum]|nr:hypothetical protein [Nostoc favosum]